MTCKSVMWQHRLRSKWSIYKPRFARLFLQSMRDMEGSSSRDIGWSMALQTPSFLNYELENCDMTNIFYWKSPGTWHFIVTVLRKKNSNQMPLPILQSNVPLSHWPWTSAFPWVMLAIRCVADGGTNVNVASLTNVSFSYDLDFKETFVCLCIFLYEANLPAMILFDCESERGPRH